MAFATTSVTTGSVTLAALPSGSANDDLVLVLVGSDFGGISMANANWTQIDVTRSLTNDGHTWSLWWRVIDGTEAGKLTWTIGGGSDIVLRAWRFTGRDTSTPVSAQVWTAESTGSSPKALALTAVTAASGDDVLAIWALDTSTGSGGWTGGSYTSGYTEISEDSFNWTSSFAAEQDNVSSGSTGTITGTATNATDGLGIAGWLVALKSSGGPGPAAPASGNALFYGSL